jgi:hypothetical protein
MEAECITTIKPNNYEYDLLAQCDIYGSGGGMLTKPSI